MSAQHPDYLQKILTAQVYDVAIQTPLDPAPNLSARIHNKIFLKREDMQPVFSFKLRGAYNKMAHLSPAVLKRGVICASAGNHAQGVALSAKRLGTRAVIVMPTTTPAIKIDAVKRHGGEVVLAGRYPSRAELTRWLALDASASAEHWRDCAAALAARSDHPVSRALVSAAIDGSQVSQVRAWPGRGVGGTLDGHAYWLGNARLAQQHGADHPALAAQWAQLAADGQTGVLLGSGSQVLAVFAVADRVRPQAAQAVAELHQLGIHTVMLTGDTQGPAQAVATAVGMDEVRAGLLPEDKLLAVEQLIRQHGVVGMVGDGINDGPALARADVGFAMAAAGSATALETADVALMDDNPRKLAWFIRLSRHTGWVLWQNIALALGLKGLFLALTLTGHGSLWLAVLADVGASLLVVANGLRVLRYR